MVNHRKKLSTRDSGGFPTLCLPRLSKFNRDEKLLARVIIGIVRRPKAALVRGKLIECIVARLLGARFPRGGIARWDLLLKDGTRIEVRSGDKSFSLKGNKDVHLWVFVHKRSLDAEAFSVAAARAVKELKGRGISAKKLRKKFQPVGASDLAAKVAEVRGRARRLRSA
jgi:hypothetical protein